MSSGGFFNKINLPGSKRVFMSYLPLEKLFNHLYVQVIYLFYLFILYVNFV